MAQHRIQRPKLLLKRFFAISLSPAGRRAHFYTYDLHAGRVQRVLGQWGGYEIKSLESFAACSDAGGSLVAFLGDQVRLVYGTADLPPRRACFSAFRLVVSPSTCHAHFATDAATCRRC